MLLNRSSVSVAPLTAQDFCHYTYENGHRGTFPLDVNKHGVLRKNPGIYNADFEYGFDVSMSASEVGDEDDFGGANRHASKQSEDVRQKSENFASIPVHVPENLAVSTLVAAQQEIDNVGGQA